MSAISISGVFAAALTPRNAEDEFDEEQLKQLIQALLAKGIRGFALNGATGELCLTTVDEFERIVSIAAETIGDRGEFLTGIGSTSVVSSIQLAKIASKAGAVGLLLPAPYFFPYEQSDLLAYFGEVAENVDLPILLYNLPRFTSPIEAATVLRLIEKYPNIVGIKDSSGSLEILRALAAAPFESSKIIGNDSALVPGLKAGLCDGVISGVACALPELIQQIYTAPLENLDALGAQLDEFISHLTEMPVPWGIKWAADARGFVTAHFSQPLSDERKRQGHQFVTWFNDWLDTPGLSTNPVSAY